MKNLRFWLFGLTTLATFGISTFCAAQQPAASTTPSPSSNQTLRIGMVNTKKCLEESKLGKQEQVNFEKMKNQMETVLQDKEKLLEEIESKLNDDDYMDSISEDQANELRRKKRTIRNEGVQLQNQYMQSLQQANMKIIQKLTEAISKASAQVAQDKSNGQLDIILTDEAATYFAPALDISSRIITKMNANFDAETKDSSAKPKN